MKPKLDSTDIIENLNFALKHTQMHSNIQYLLIWSLFFILDGTSLLISNVFRIVTFGTTYLLITGTPYIITYIITGVEFVFLIILLLWNYRSKITAIDEDNLSLSPPWKMIIFIVLLIIGKATLFLYNNLIWNNVWLPQYYPTAVLDSIQKGFVFIIGYFIIKQQFSGLNFKNIKKILLFLFIWLIITYILMDMPVVRTILGIDRCIITIPTIHTQTVEINRFDSIFCYVSHFIIVICEIIASKLLLKKRHIVQIGESK